MELRKCVSLEVLFAVLIVGLLIPVSASAQGDDIGLSDVIALTPDPIPGGAQTLCFTVDVVSPDFEYMDRFDVDLPDGWTVNTVWPDSVPPADGCSGSLPPVVGTEAGNVVYWQSTGYPPQTGCGAWMAGVFDFCVDVDVHSGAGSPWMFAWYIEGDSYGSTPHFASGAYGPVAYAGGAAAIELTKTVGTVPAVCAPTNIISVATGADVYYCYHVENTGSVTFEYHTLDDDQLGNLLMNFPQTLAPGATYDHIEMATISTPTVNNASWTAADSAGGFTVDDTINYGWEDISATGTPFALSDDDTLVLPVGFTFDYYGMSYTDIEISSNGFLSVNAAGDSGCCTGDPLPDVGTPNGVIAGWWEDLDPGDAGSEFYYETLGTSPNRRVVISVINVQHFPSGNPVTLQYKLFETSNIVEVHYQAAPSDGGTHSAGIENQDGTIGIQYYLGTDPLAVGAPLAVRYTPTVTIEASDTGFAEVLLADPNIDVNPLFLATNQMVNTVVVETLDIGNTGVGDLDWLIEEDGATKKQRPTMRPAGPGYVEQGAERIDAKVGLTLEPTGAPTMYDWPDIVLYDNGPLVNCAGCGSGGADESQLQTALGMGTYGFGHQVTAGNRIADDFEVTDPSGWWIDEITFFAYQSFSSTTSTFTGVNLQIWDGPPDNPASTVVFGDTTTNRMASSTWSNIYRVLDTSSGNTDRPIMANVVTVGVMLPQGTYWLDWQADGSLASGPWAPPITINGTIGTGNALQWTTAWAPAIDVEQQGFPFIVEGTGTPPACVSPSDIPWLSLSPDMGTTPPAGSTQVDVTFDSTGMAVDTYTANLCITSNDPDPGPGNGTDLVIVPVEMVVVIPVELQSFTIE